MCRRPQAFLFSSQPADEQIHERHRPLRLQLGLVHQLASEQVLAVLIDELAFPAVRVQAKHAPVGAGVALAMPHTLVCCTVLQNHAKLGEDPSRPASRTRQEHAAG